ncbi:MAG: LarC family nickel insertion protein [Granulosicoccus sp.]
MAVQVIRHVHLDPVGGIAGDMFIAAMLDLFPQALPTCHSDLADSGVTEHVGVSLESGKSHGLAVKRFCVKNKSHRPRATGHYRDLKLMLENSALQSAVKGRALALLELLAIAESQVHGVALDDVHFHEVADWDSITDMVAAASLIERNSITRWSCSCLPIGSGLVKTEHGMLPVPAPATEILLQGLATYDDGEPGERVTPTGAAIVKYLFSISADTDQFATRPNGTGVATGMGAGQRHLQERPNIVRCSLMEIHSSAMIHLQTQLHTPQLDQGDFNHRVDHVAQLSFAIDDMTSEELAVALQYIRQSDGVIDVSHQTSYGKKGRMMFDVRVLCLPLEEPLVSRLCFSETSTLGMRVQMLARRVLRREEFRIKDSAGSAGVKMVTRPVPCDGAEQNTLKVESDDLRRIPGLHARRERSRQLADKSSTVDGALEPRKSDD